jgi:protein TonB
MYGTIQHSGRRTRLAGVATAVLMTAGAGYFFTSSLVYDFVPMVEKKMEVFLMAPKEEPLPLPVEKEKPVEKVDVKQPELVAPDIPFVPETPVITAPLAPEVPAVAVAPGPTSPNGSDRVPPKLRSTDKPPYPVQSVRASEQGTTHLEICVTDKGNVQSVSIAGSSGFPRLDEAAAKWVRNARFSPGSVGGVAQSMCGHDVFYQWNLSDAR